MTIKEAKQKHESQLMQLPGVVGVGLGKQEDRDVIVILVSELSRKLERRLPTSIEGFEVRIQESGPIRAL
mgnify:FL=1